MTTDSKPRNTLTPMQRIQLGNALMTGRPGIPDRVLARKMSKQLGFEVTQQQLQTVSAHVGRKLVPMPSADELWDECERLKQQLADMPGAAPAPDTGADTGSRPPSVI